MSGERDPYTDPVSGLFRNRLGIKDAADLQEAEQRIVAQRARDPIPEGDFDLAHLCAIHRQLFGDVYPWAGEVRTVNIAKEGTPFARPEFIEPAAKDIAKDLVRRDHLQNLPRERFAAELGEVYADLNVLHPFREGNGRATRRFAEALAERAGFELDWRQVGRAEWIEASKASARGDNTPLQEVFKGVVRERVQEQAAEKAAAYRDLPREQAQALYPDLAYAYKMEAAAQAVAARQGGSAAALDAVARQAREKIAAHIERGGSLKDLAGRSTAEPEPQSTADLAGPEL